MTKLLRIARLKKLLDKYEDLFDLNQYLGMVATLFVICSAAHYMACAWYVVGLGEEEHYGEFQPVKGWVRNKDAAGWSNYDLAEGCETEAGCVIPYSRRYWVRSSNKFGIDRTCNSFHSPKFCGWACVASGGLSRWMSSFPCTPRLA